MDLFLLGNRNNVPLRKCINPAFGMRVHVSMLHLDQEGSAKKVWKQQELCRLCKFVTDAQVDHKWKLEGAEERAAEVLRARLRQGPQKRKP